MPLEGSYLDRDELKALSTAPEGVIEGDWIDPTGAWTDARKVRSRIAWWAFIDARLVALSSEMNALLGKRYEVPFGAPAPAIVKVWLADMVTPEIYDKRGWDVEDAQATRIVGKADKARAEIEKAADEVAGLYELPLRQDTAGEGIGPLEGPRAYSEASPYDWLDRQREAVRR